MAGQSDGGLLKGQDLISALQLADSRRCQGVGPSPLSFHLSVFHYFFVAILPFFLSFLLSGSLMGECRGINGLFWKEFASTAPGSCRLSCSRAWAVVPLGVFPKDFSDSEKL